MSHKWQFLFIFILGAFVLISVFLDMTKRRLIFNKKEIPFLVFLLTMISGMINVKEPSVAYYHFWSYIFPIPFLYFFAKIGFENRYGKLIIRTISFMAALVCICGFIEFAAKQNFIYDSILDNIYYRIFVAKRMISTHFHPVPLGTYLVAILPLPVALSLREKRLFAKGLLIICAAIIFIGIILTFSKGALLSSYIAVSLTVFLLAKRRKSFFFLTFILLIAGVIVGTSLLNYSTIYFSRYSLQSFYTRFGYFISRFTMLVEMLKDYSFFGAGFGHFRVLFDSYLPQLAHYHYSDKILDCMYLTLLIETGFFGLAGFSVFIFSFFKRIRTRLKSLRETEDGLFLVCFLSGFLGIMCAFLTYDGLYWRAPSYLFWSYAGILSLLSRPRAG
jgi:O-antigen ligase